MQRQPHWFSEGIASYFESAHYRDDGVFVLGDVPLDRLAQLSACRELMGLSQLIELEPDERHDAVVQKRLQKLTSGCRG